MKISFRSPRHRITRSPDSSRGFMLLALMLLVTLVLIGLSLEAPKIGQQIKRDKEEELIHRGNEYKNAVKRYFRKFGQYPVSLDQLSNTNNQRFLRRRFKDPFTGKDDWRLLHPGEVQVNAANGGVVAAGQPGQAPQQPGQQQFGPSTQFGQTPGTLNQPGGFASPALGPPATPQAGTDQATSGAVPGAGTPGITPAGNLTGGLGNSPVIGGGPMVGVASTSTLKSIKEINGKNHYNDWQFVYDPRLEPALAPPGAPGTVGTNPIGGSTTPGQQPGQTPTTSPPGTTQPRVTN